MRLILTLVVRDEADIIDDHLAFHLEAGVDFVIVTDHRSIDGTPEILERYARQGVLRVIREDSEHTFQKIWQTRMARLAATEYEADWVINSDADEFWWPRGPSLKHVLGAVPRQHGVVRGLVRNFVPRRDDSGVFAERMTVRLSTSAPINDPTTPFRPVVKVAHRGHPRVVIGEGGSHQVFGLPGRLFDAWHPVEVLHMPLRSQEQCARKYRKTWSGWAENLRGDLARAKQASDEGRTNPIWDRVALDDSEVERGLEAGSLVLDTRLRDALRLLRRDVAASSSGAANMRSAVPAPAEVADHAFDVAVFEEAELIRYQRWADDVKRRVLGLEGGASSGRRRLRSR